MGLLENMLMDQLNEDLDEKAGLGLAKMFNLCRLG